MAESEDPQEDLQVVAMTAGAAAARVAETVIRGNQARQADAAAAAERHRRYDGPSSNPEANSAGRHFGVRAEDDPSRPRDDDDRPRATLENPDTWWKTGDSAPTPAQRWTLTHSGQDVPATKAEASKAITALSEGHKRDPEAVKARGVADAMNGRPTTYAARWERVTTAAQQPPRIQQRQQERSR